MMETVLFLVVAAIVYAHWRRTQERRRFDRWLADHQRRTWGRGEDQICWKWPADR